MAPVSLSERTIAIIKASRPPGYCFGPILFAIGLIHSRRMPNNLNALLMAVTQAFSLSFPLCTIVFGINDVYDYDSDVQNPRKTLSGPEGGVLAPAYHSSVQLVARISTAIILFVSLATRQPQNIIATALLILLGWQYSAPPLRLKEVPILDSLSNGLIVLLAWFVGYTFGRGSFSCAPGKGYALALCAAGVHALGAVIDVDSDVSAGQKTIATFMGPHRAACLGFLAYAIALLTEYSTSIFGIYLWGGLIAMLTPCLHLRWAHGAFRFIVYWSLSMSIFWVGSKAFAI